MAAGPHPSWPRKRLPQRSPQRRSLRRRRLPAPQLAGPRRSPRRADRGTPARSARSAWSARSGSSRRRSAAYANLVPGQSYTAETLDQALKDLYATELFADVVITGADTGNLVITVRENPVINRIVLEGNKRIKDDKITPEIKLAPRQIFTRSKVRADVARIIELYRRQGRFAATRRAARSSSSTRTASTSCSRSTRATSPRSARSTSSATRNIRDGRLRKEMFTKRSRRPARLLQVERQLRSRPPCLRPAEAARILPDPGLCRFPRRLGARRADPRPPRLHHHLCGRGRRRATSSATVEVESDIRDFNADSCQAAGQDRSRATGSMPSWSRTRSPASTSWPACSAMPSPTSRPTYKRDAEKRTMGVTFRVAETPRVYVERIDIQGNTVTRDKVIRREFRLAEGDAFNAFRVKRSPGPHPVARLLPGKSGDQADPGLGARPRRARRRRRGEGDRRAAAFGRLLEPRAVHPRRPRSPSAISWARARSCAPAINYSSYSKSIELGFTEPYLFDSNILLGGELFRRDYNSFNLRRQRAQHDL